MSERGKFVTAGELAVLFGKPVTHRWLSKYARKGLLPSAIRVPGLGQGKGREARYPKSATRQVHALRRHQKRYGKNLHAVGWALWRDGFDVPRRYWREPLNEVARSWNRVRTFLRNERQAGQFRQNMETRKRSPARLLGHARRTLRSQYPAFVDTVIDLVAGKYEAISALANYDTPGAEKAYQALTKVLIVRKEQAEAKLPLLNVGAGDLDREFAIIMRYSNRDIAKWLSTLTDRDITTGRDEIFPFLSHLLGFEALGVKLFKESIGVRTLDWCLETPAAQAAMLLGWMLIRDRPGIRSDMERLTESLRIEFRKLEEKRDAKALQHALGELRG